MPVSQPIGLYIHVPFCVRKCPYCDFYSLPLTDDSTLDRYTDALLRSLDRWSERLPGCRADTLYLGGGTPALLGGRRIGAILRCADERFSLFSADRPEVTLEANPADGLYDTFSAFAAAGGSRVSLGMQSADERELSLLGRRHAPADVQRAVADARRAGIGEISLDLMLATSGQTQQSVRRSVDRICTLGAQHASAYLLKIEPGTPYGQSPPPLPDDDAAADLYLTAADALSAAGYRQYEISNFAVPGHESRHNLKYWDSRPYLGIGPAASSCLGGHRFSYPRDIRDFFNGGEPVDEPDPQIAPGSPEEYALLRLRLCDGLREDGYLARFGQSIPTEWRRRAAALPSALAVCDADGIRLTTQGFLVSNALIGRILG